MQTNPYAVIPEEIFGRFSFLRNLFTRAEFKNCLLLLMGICFSPKKTIASMANWLENIDQSVLNKFLTQGKWDLKKFFGAYHKQIKEQVKGKVVTLIIDDSKIEKTGESIQRVGWEFDHCKRLSILCFSIVFSLVKIDGIDLPLPFAVEACKKKKDDQKRKKSKITIAMKMIQAFLRITKKASKRIILFDSWYSAVKLIHSIPKDVFWATRLKFKKSRNVWLRDCWLPVWKFARRVNSWNFRKVKVNGRYFFVYIERVLIKDLGGVYLVVSKLKRGSKEYQLFISNMDNAQEILENYDERWDIEVFFRSVKQNFGIGDVQIRSYCGNRRYWSMVLLAYSSISCLQHLWKKTCKTAGETLNRLRKLLQNAAADYGMSLGRFTHIYVCENFAKL